MAPKEKGKKLRKKKTISENVVTFIETLKNGFHFRCEMVTCKQYLPVIQQKLIQLYLTLVWRYLNPHQRPCQDPGDAPGLQLLRKSFSPAIPMSLPSVFFISLAIPESSAAMPGSGGRTRSTALSTNVKLYY